MEHVPSSSSRGPTPERAANTCPRWSLHTSDLSGFMSKGQSRNNPDVHCVMSGYKQNGVHPLGGHYWVMKWDEAPTPTTQMDLGNVMLTERSQTRKAACCGIPIA